MVALGGRHEAAIFNKSFGWVASSLARVLWWFLPTSSKKKGQIICSLLLSYFGKMPHLSIKFINVCKFVHMPRPPLPKSNPTGNFNCIWFQGFEMQRKTQRGKSLLHQGTRRESWMASFWPTSTNLAFLFNLWSCALKMNIFPVKN